MQDCYYYFCFRDKVKGILTSYFLKSLILCGIFSILPAYAGMNLGLIIRLLTTFYSPRVCGDEPELLAYRDEKGRFSPRMRG